MNEEGEPTGGTQTADIADNPNGMPAKVVKRNMCSKCGKEIDINNFKSFVDGKCVKCK